MTTQVLAMDANGQGIGLVPLSNAVRLLVRKAARVVEWFDNKVIWVGPVKIVNAVFQDNELGGGLVVRETMAIIKAPAVIQVFGFLRIGRKGYPSPTTSNVIARDGYQCMNTKCGKLLRHDVKKLTKDHILPLSKGGKNVWENVTTLCQKCNNRKSDRTLEEMGWKLIKPPHCPTSQLELQLARTKNVPSEWNAKVVLKNR